MSDIASAKQSLVVHREKLTDGEREGMFQLLSAHFEGVSESQFERDLSAKNQVILIRDKGRLVGFSTLLAYETSYQGEIISVVYSGDTIVAPEAWRSTTLFRTWITSVNNLRSEFPRGDFYWLLLTSGFRTYRLLPLFWKEFFPRFDQTTPPETQGLLNHLASEQFGAQFDSASGIVRFPKPQCLRERLREVPPGRSANPDIAYFLSRNPCHSQGDELVCLTRLSADNLSGAGRRMVGSR